MGRIVVGRAARPCSQTTEQLCSAALRHPGKCPMGTSQLLNPLAKTRPKENVNTPSPVSTPRTLSGSDGETLKFIRWEGNKAQYLDNSYSAATNLSVPSGVQNVSLTLVHK